MPKIDPTSTTDDSISPGDLLDIQDGMSTGRRFIVAAQLISTNISDPEGSALAAVLNSAQDLIDAAYASLSALRGQPEDRLS